MDALSRLSADPIGGLSGAIEQSGGLEGMLGQLRAGGLGDAVDSWVGPGANQTVEPQQLGAALGPDTVSRLSSGSGIDIAALLPMLAAFLPQIIDMLTPDGAVPAGGLGGAGGSTMPDLGGLLGGMLGGSGGSGASGSGAGLDDMLGGLGGLFGGDKKGG